MSSINSNISKTEVFIAIDDSDNSDNDNIDGGVLIDGVSQTLNSIIDSIETMPSIDYIESQCLLIDDNKSDNEEVVNKTDVSSVEKPTEDRIRAVDDIEDIDNMEVNIYSRYGFDESSNDMDFYGIEEEGEDSIVIEYMTDNQLLAQKTQEMDESDDEDIQIIEDVDSGNKEDKSKQIGEEVIDLSDDEEDCVIINDSFSLKLNKIIESEDRTQQPKRSNSPVYTSESFIPLSLPSTSSGFRSSLEPVRNFRCSRNLKSQTQTKPQKSGNSSYCSPASTSSRSLTDLFRTPIESTYYESNREPLFVCSSYIQQNSSAEEDTFLYDNTIPFLYQEPRASTSSDLIGSSNVKEIDLICESVKLDRNIVQNVVNLIEDQCTVPFIVRYRQSAISGIDADRVRRITNVYNEIKAAKERAKEVEQLLKKQDRTNPRLIATLNRCKNVFEVNQLFNLCQNQSTESGSEAEQYRNLGLSDSALSILEGKRLDANHFINRFAFGLDSPEKIEKGWSIIIADIISKDCEVLEFLISATKDEIPILQTELIPERIDELRKEKNNQKNSDLIHKYIRFGSFMKPINQINAHTYMAIERGEEIGLLKIYIEFDTIILNKLIELCLQKWNRCISHFLIKCVRIAFNNQLKRSLEVYNRFELRHTSHMKALDVFRSNVKYLLLEPPLRGEFVIGVDPGHGSGYKVAVVSPWLVPLDTMILKLDENNYESSAIKLKKLMEENRCSIIALGNGTGCRRFEDMLLNKIKSGFFEGINVKYKIINESGVSWYSVTEEAKRDLPNFPPQMIGAISIARRLIDPLSELVKVDPKRLQVGMYMRDIDEESVKKAFHEVAVECVSFCGVDVNVASFELLSCVSGLQPNIARLIIEKRERDGLFKCRSQLKNIDGIGWKQFEQCAGFIKVTPLTRTQNNITLIKRDKDNDFPNKRCATSTDDYDPLDSTIVHPESYSCANTYLELIGADKDEIGKQSIRFKIESGYKKYCLTEMAQLCNTHTSNMKLIIEGLSNSIDFDYRTNFKKIYIPEIQNFEDLTVGMQLKGRVVNVTPMGAFIDCGIVGGINAYLRAKECDRNSIVVNDNVLVTIESINKVQHKFVANILKVFKSNVKYF